MVMHKMMYKIDTPHLYKRDGVYYFVRRVPVDIRSYYSSNRISMSLKTKSLANLIVLWSQLINVPAAIIVHVSDPSGLSAIVQNITKVTIMTNSYSNGGSMRDVFSAV